MVDVNKLYVRLKIGILLGCLIIIVVWVIIVSTEHNQHRWELLCGSNKSFSSFTAVAAGCIPLAYALFTTTPSLKNKLVYMIDKVPKQWFKFIDSGATPYFTPNSYKIRNGVYVRSLDKNISPDERGLPIVDETIPLHSFNMDIYQQYYKPPIEEFLSVKQQSKEEILRTYVPSQAKHITKDQLSQSIDDFYDLLKDLICVEAIGETCVIVQARNTNQLLIHRKQYREFLEDPVSKAQRKRNVQSLDRTAEYELSRISGLRWLVDTLCKSDDQKNETYSNTHIYEPIATELWALVKMWPDRRDVIYNAFCQFVTSRTNKLGYNYLARTHDILFMRVKLIEEFPVISINIEKYLESREGIDLKPFYDFISSKSNQYSTISFEQIYDSIKPNADIESVGTTIKDLTDDKHQMLFENNINKINPNGMPFTFSIKKMLKYLPEDLVADVKKHNSEVAKKASIANKLYNNLPSMKLPHIATINLNLPKSYLDKTDMNLAIIKNQVDHQRRQDEQESATIDKTKELKDYLETQRKITLDETTDKESRRAAEKEVKKTEKELEDLEKRKGLFANLRAYGKQLLESSSNLIGILNKRQNLIAEVNNLDVAISDETEAKERSLKAQQIAEQANAELQNHVSPEEQNAAYARAQAASQAAAVANAQLEAQAAKTREAAQVAARAKEDLRKSEEAEAQAEKKQQELESKKAKVEQLLRETPTVVSGATQKVFKGVLAGVFEGVADRVAERSKKVSEVRFRDNIARTTNALGNTVDYTMAELQSINATRNETDGINPSEISIEISNSEKQNQELKSVVDEMKKKVEVMTSELAAKTDTIESKTKELNATRKKIDEKHEEMKKSGLITDAMKSELSKLKQNKSDQEGIIETLEKDLKSVKDNLSKMMIQSKQIETSALSRISKLRKQLLSQGFKGAVSQNILERSSAAMAKQLRSVEQDKIALQSKLADVSFALDSSSLHKQNLTNAFDELSTKLNTLSEQKEMERMAAEEKIQKYEETISGQSRELQSAANDHTEKQANLLIIESKLSDALATKIDLQSRVELLEEQKRQSEAITAENLENAKQTVSELIVLRSSKAEFDSQLTDLKKQHQEEIQTIEETYAKNANESLQASLDEMQKLHRHELDTYKLQLENSQVGKEDKERELSVMEMQHRQDLAQLQEEHKTAVFAYEQQLAANIESIDQKNKQEIENMKRAFEEQMANQKMQNEEMNQQAIEASKQNQLLQEQINKFETEPTELKTKNDSLEQRIKHLDALLKDQTAEAKREAALRNAHIAEMNNAKSMLAESVPHIEQLKANLREAEKSARDAEVKVTLRITNETRGDKEQIEKLKSEILAQSTKAADAIANVESLDNTIAKQSSRLEKITTQLDKINNENNNLIATVDELTQANSKLNRYVKQMERQATKEMEDQRAELINWHDQEVDTISNDYQTQLKKQRLDMDNMRSHYENCKKLGMSYHTSNLFTLFPINNVATATNLKPFTVSLELKTLREMTDKLKQLTDPNIVITNIQLDNTNSPLFNYISNNKNILFAQPNKNVHNELSTLLADNLNKTVVLMYCIYFYMINHSEEYKKILKELSDCGYMPIGDLTAFKQQFVNVGTMVEFMHYADIFFSPSKEGQGARNISRYASFKKFKPKESITDSPADVAKMNELLLNAGFNVYTGKREAAPPTAHIKSAISPVKLLKMSISKLLDDHILIDEVVTGEDAFGEKLTEADLRTKENNILTSINRVMHDMKPFEHEYEEVIQYLDQLAVKIKNHEFGDGFDTIWGNLYNSLAVIRGKLV